MHNGTSFIFRYFQIVLKKLLLPGVCIFLQLAAQLYFCAMAY